MILLRYPRVRQEITAIKSAVSDIATAPKNLVKALGKQLSNMEEDRVEDLAMKALLEGESSKNSILAADEEEANIGDGSWLLPLIMHNSDKGRYKHIVDTMMVKDLLPLPLRLSDVNKSEADFAFERLDAALSTCPSVVAKFGKRGSEENNNQQVNSKHKKTRQ